MDSRDIALIEKCSKQDALLRSLYEKHKDFDKKLQKFSKKSYLTPSEKEEEQDLKKRKLAGKDRMMKILEKYR